jgi:hypothetical protein
MAALRMSIGAVFDIFIIKAKTVPHHPLQSPASGLHARHTARQTSCMVASNILHGYIKHPAWLHGGGAHVQGYVEMHKPVWVDQ